MNKRAQSNGISRRQFLAGVSAAAAFTLVPRHVLAASGEKAPSDKLNIAGIGIGGMGKNNVNACESENITALCDVDWEYAKESFQKYPKARKWKDYRKMLEEQKDFDAVIIATPDHAHAVIAMDAMRRAKHVYVQKPMTHTVAEARMLTEAARKYKVVTQMGNQGHSGDGVRKICEWIWAGIIGDVKEAHAWTNRPVWPQGIDRPTDTPPVSQDMDWDLWIGPAPMRPYNPAYHAFKWRGWWDFGCGALGDMACHVLDPVFVALKLKYPISVLADSTPVNKETYPSSSTIQFEFPAREGMPEVRLTWYDGGRTPQRPKELEEGRKLDQASSNVLFIGSKGVLRCGEYGDDPQLIPYSRMKEIKFPEPTLPRIKTSHEMNWVGACKTGGQATSNFDYAGPFTEAVVMGNLALKRLGKKLLWDGINMKFTNDQEANQFVTKPYRQGWKM
jgi:predicted dehydrogenase